MLRMQHNMRFLNAIPGLANGTTRFVVVSLMLVLASAGCFDSNVDGGAESRHKIATKDCGLVLDTDPPPVLTSGRQQVLAYAEAHPEETQSLFVVLSGEYSSEYPEAGVDEAVEQYIERRQQEASEALAGVFCELRRMDAKTISTTWLRPGVVFEINASGAVKIATEWPDRIYVSGNNGAEIPDNLDDVNGI